MVAHAQVALKPHHLQLFVTSHHRNEPPSPDQSNVARHNGVRPYPEITCTENHSFYTSFGSALKRCGLTPSSAPVFGPYLIAAATGPSSDVSAALSIRRAF